MVYIAQIKNFEFKLKFEFYYGYKMNQVAVALNTLKLLARFSISKHHPWQLAQNTIYHKLHIGYHEPSTNLMILKLYLHFIQLKNIGTACGFSWFANMFKISSNFMSKVLKMIQLHDFSTNFTTLFYKLIVQIWHIRQKFFKWHINVKNSKLIETCIWLKYRVQNNVFEVEKLKDVQKQFKKILWRALW
jgi:hypothetical protein